MKDCTPVEAKTVTSSGNSLQSGENDSNTLILSKEITIIKAHSIKILIYSASDFFTVAFEIVCEESLDHAANVCTHINLYINIYIYII
jgi:hypothetical protein